MPRSGLGVVVGAGADGVAGACAAAGAWALFRASAAARTSCLRIHPPTPVPVIEIELRRGVVRVHGAEPTLLRTLIDALSA